MNSIVRRFNFDESELSMMKGNDRVWFKGTDVARILGYTDPDQAIRKNEDVKEKREVYQGLDPSFRRGNPHPVATYINEPGFYSLAFSSKTEAAKAFKKWVCGTVLPSIRRTGQYQLPSPIGKQGMLLNETDLHYRVVAYLRRFDTNALIVPGLGELQDSSAKRCEAYRKGYRGGINWIPNPVKYAERYRNSQRERERAAVELRCKRVNGPYFKILQHGNHRGRRLHA